MKGKKNDDERPSGKGQTRNWSGEISRHSTKLTFRHWAKSITPKVLDTQRGIPLLRRSGKLAYLSMALPLVKLTTSLESRTDCARLLVLLKSVRAP
jgi:hypothetical protein